MNKTLRHLLSFCVAIVAPAAMAQEPVFSDRISDHRVNVIMQDSVGYIWFGTSHGLNRFNGTGYQIYYSSGNESGLQNDNIIDMVEDSHGVIYLGTECGLMNLNRNLEGFNVTTELAYNPINRIIRLEGDEMVATGRGGLIKMGSGSGPDSRYLSSRYSPSGSGWPQKISTSPQNEIWIVRSSNDSTLLDIVDHNLELKASFFLGKDVLVQEMTPISDEEMILATSSGARCFNSRARVPGQLPAGLSPLSDEKGILFINGYKGDNILVGLRNEGMVIFNPKTGQRENIYPEETLPGQDYICFVDKDFNIWLSDRKSDVKMFPHQRLYSRLPSPIPGNTLSKNISFDNRGRLWMIDEGHLVGMESGSGDVFHISPSDDFSLMYLDGKDRLYAIMDWNSVSVYDIRGELPALVREYSFDDNIDSIVGYEDGSLMVPVGLKMAIISPDGKVTTVDNPEGVAISQAVTDPASRRSFLFTLSKGLAERKADGEIVYFANDSLRNSHDLTVAMDGSFWIASYNKGLIHFTPSTGSVESFSKEDGLPDYDIKSVLEDSSGNIWFTTPRHVMKYDVREKKFYVIHDTNYSNGASYERLSAAKGPDGKLYFGGSGGVTVVDPRISIPIPRDIPLNIEYISSGGKRVFPGEKGIVLNHRQNSFSIRFSGLDYQAASLVNYSYILEGYRKDWEYSLSSEPVNYSYLPSGHYLFRARAREQSGEWSTHEITLPVLIKPAPLASPLAKIIYILLAGILIAATIHFLTWLRTQKERLELSAQKEELQQQRIDFVTNVSHEFRTPLTMIYAPVKELVKSEKVSGKELGLVQIIEKNAERLRTLSEQILNDGNGPASETLLVRRNDLVSVIRSILENFSYAVSEKNQTLLQLLPTSLIGYFDTEKTSKIFSNILSNAIKYTPEGGTIKVRISKEGDRAVISVEDNGIGIAENMRERIFTRFDRLGAESSGQVGSGIGLNYAKRLADFCLGDLSYAPNEPQGSIFTFSLPIEMEAYPADSVSDNEEDYIPHYRSNADPGKEKTGSVLVVEDSADIRNFLYDILSDDFHVSLVQDAEEALDHLQISLPDIVVSDVIMPGKTGFQLCEEIKGNSNWSHLPVILLTAKADSKSGAEGFRSGADAYISKPFDPAYLKAAIESMVSNRRRIQEKLMNLTSMTNPTETASANDGLGKKESALLKKIHSIMDENLDNEDFNVEQMSILLNMSYSSLYAKIKDMMGITPVQYINTYRMNCARELLKKGNLTVSEVSYRIGISSPSQFSRMYKKQFGISPSKEEV